MQKHTSHWACKTRIYCGTSNWRSLDNGCNNSSMVLSYGWLYSSSVKAILISIFAQYYFALWWWWIFGFILPITFIDIVLIFCFVWNKKPYPDLNIDIRYQIINLRSSRLRFFYMQCIKYNVTFMANFSFQSGMKIGSMHFEIHKFNRRRWCVCNRYLSFHDANWYALGK